MKSKNYLAYPFTTAGPISVTLLTPTNNTLSNDDPITFTATLTPDTYNLTNATLSIWYDNGTLWQNTTNSSPSGNVSYNVTFSVSNWTIDTYYWNVYGVQGNGNGTNSSYASENFTLQWVPFEVTGEDYNTHVLETDSQTFYVNISTLNNILSTTINLNYDGEEYFTETNCVDGTCVLNNTIDIPLVSSGTSENKTFFWELRLFDLNNNVYEFNTTSNQQNVSRIFMEFTNATYPDSTVNFTIWDEVNRTQLTPMSFAATFDFCFLVLKSDF